MVWWGGEGCEVLGFESSGDRERGGRWVEKWEVGEWRAFPCRSGSRVGVRFGDVE